MSASTACLRRVMLHPVLLSALAVALGVEAFAYFDRHAWPPIRSDGWGYYLHLPATLIWGDPGLSFLRQPDLPAEIARYQFADGAWQGLSDTATGYLDKYALGPAVLQLPFFLVAWVVTALTQSSVNGFELPFQAANALSGAFYFALGSLLAYRTARLRYGRGPSLAAVALAVLATNVLLYGSFDASYSHAYGFCLVAGVMFLTIRRIETGGAPAMAEFLLFGVLMGLAVMVRPTNVVAGLLYLPFVRHTPAGRAALGTIASLAAAAVAASPQMLLWLATTGQLVYYSYKGEGFTLLAPSFWAYMTSVRKGVFFWHPAYLGMIAAVAAQMSRRTLETSVLLVIIGLNIWLGASWSDISFGGSFGCRQIVEMLPLMVPASAAAILWLAGEPVRRVAACAMAALLIAVNAVQFHGYMIGKMPSNNTTIDQYREFWAETLGVGP